MTLESLSQDIFEKIDVQKKELEQQYYQKSKEYGNYVQELLNDHKTNEYSKAEEQISLYKQKTIGSAKSKASQIILQAEKTVDEKKYSKILEEFLNLSDKEKKSFYQKLLKHIANKIEIETVYVNEKDKALLQSITKHSFIIDNSFIGGIKVENKTKKELIDATIETILENGPNN